MLDSECNASILTDNRKNMNIPTTIFCESISKWCKPPTTSIGGPPKSKSIYIYISKSFKVISREAYQKKNHLQYAFGGGNPNFTKCWENQKIVHLLQLGETLAFNSLRGLEAELSVRGLMGGNAMPECPDAISGMQGRGYVRLYRVNGIFSNGHQSERMTHQHQKKLNHPNPLFNLKFTGSLTST